MLFLLDLQHGAILEGPTGDVGLAADALDKIRRLEGRPEVGELVELDVMPDVGQWGADDAALENRGRGGNCGVRGHCAGEFA